MLSILEARFTVSPYEIEILLECVSNIISPNLPKCHIEVCAHLNSQMGIENELVITDYSGDK